MASHKINWFKVFDLVQYICPQMLELGQHKQIAGTGVVDFIAGKVGNKKNQKKSYSSYSSKTYILANNIFIIGHLN